MAGDFSVFAVKKYQERSPEELQMQKNIWEYNKKGGKNMAEEMFKTTLMGGFDKDDVLTQVQKLKEEAYAEKIKLIKAGKEKDKRIEELNRQIHLKDVQREKEIEELKRQQAEAIEELKKEHEQELEEMRQNLKLKSDQKEKLERDISEKYQKYIDRYDLIGGLVLEAQEKAEKIVEEAVQKRDLLMEEARVEAQKCLDAVQSEVDDKLAEGKRKYIAVQEEMNEIVELINQAQRRFMSSYREVHQIISTMPESMRELEDENEEEHLPADENETETVVSQEEESSLIEEETDNTEEEQDIQESLDDEEDLLEDELLRFLEKEDNEEE